MAIFSGSWLDASGDPFDPEAKVLQTWTGGGMAAVRRHAIRPHPERERFIATGNLSRDTWQNVLSSANRSAWATAGITGSTRRGSVLRDPVNGYLAWSCLTWVDLYTNGATSRTSPATEFLTYLTATIVSVNPATQQLTYEYTWTGETIEDLNASVAVYQVNPLYQWSDAPIRQTRLLDLFELPPAPPFTITRTADLRWPLAVGDLARVYFRGRAPDYYQFETLQARVVP